MLLAVQMVTNLLSETTTSTCERTNIRPQNAIGEKFTKYSGGGYSVYRTNGGWVLQNGNNWTKHNGGEDCCPRDGGMIKFESSECTLTNENRDCSWPQGIEAEIHCA